MRYLFLLLLFCSPKLFAQNIVSVYFDLNSAILTNDSKVKLDGLANNPDVQVARIVGNCDTTGSAVVNRSLSQNRASSVFKYLNSISVKKSKDFVLSGNGETKQINDNGSEALKQLNRRVDVFYTINVAGQNKKVREPYESFYTADLQKAVVGDTFSLPDVNFEGGRHVWLANAAPMLQSLVDILKQNGNLHVELQGHICCEYSSPDGLDEDLGTYDLSINRAKAVKDFLQKNGINEKRINFKGLGNARPLVYPETTPFDETINRRVEIMIISK